MKTLQIIRSAYRCTIEEQDDPAIWISHAMHSAGAQLDVLLMDNAVSYALAGQDATGLQFGDKKQTRPPDLVRDIETFAGKGVQVFVVTDDLERRGIDGRQLLPTVEGVARSSLAQLLDDYDRVWAW